MFEHRQVIGDALEYFSAQFAVRSVEVRARVGQGQIDLFDLFGQVFIGEKSVRSVDRPAEIERGVNLADIS